jgi:hypothetical protein
MHSGGASGKDSGFVKEKGVTTALADAGPAETTSVDRQNVTPRVSRLVRDAVVNIGASSVYGLARARDRRTAAGA